MQKYPLPQRVRYVEKHLLLKHLSQPYQTPFLFHLKKQCPLESSAQIRIQNQNVDESKGI